MLKAGTSFQKVCIKGMSRLWLPLNSGYVLYLASASDHKAKQRWYVRITIITYPDLPQARVEVELVKCYIFITVLILNRPPYCKTGAGYTVCCSEWFVLWVSLATQPELSVWTSELDLLILYCRVYVPACGLCLIDHLVAQTHCFVMHTAVTIKRRGNLWDRYSSKSHVLDVNIVQSVWQAVCINCSTKTVRGTYELEVQGSWYVDFLKTKSSRERESHFSPQ